VSSDTRPQRRQPHLSAGAQVRIVNRAGSPGRYLYRVVSIGKTGQIARIARVIEPEGVTGIPVEADRLRIEP
jgi:hypothetical protein